MIRKPQGARLDDVLDKIRSSECRALFQAVSAELFWSPLSSDDHEHELALVNADLDAWRLRLADRQEFHLRGTTVTPHYTLLEIEGQGPLGVRYEKIRIDPPRASYDAIEVRSRRTLGEVVVVLARREDCRAWVTTLQMNPVAAAPVAAAPVKGRTMKSAMLVAEYAALGRAARHVPTTTPDAATG